MRRISLIGRELVHEFEPLGEHDDVVELDRAASAVRDPSYPENWCPPADPERGGLHVVGSGAADALDESVERMPCLFKPRVDASRPGVLLLDRGATGEVKGQIGRRDLNRHPVGSHEPVPDEHVITRCQAQLRSNVGGSWFLAEFDGYLWPPSAQGSVGQEGASAVSPFAAAEPVTGETLDRDVGTDVDPTTGSAGDQAFTAELLNGVLHGLSRDTVGLHKRCAGGQSVAWAELTGCDRTA